MKYQWSKIKKISKLIIFLSVKVFRKNNNFRKKNIFLPRVGRSVRDRQIEIIYIF